MLRKLKNGLNLRVITFFEAADSGQAKNKVKAYLNTFMDTRNKLAHPTNHVIWPDSSKVLEHIDYFEMLCAEIFNVAQIFEFQLSRRRR